MTAAVQPSNSGGPVHDGAGHLLDVPVTRMNDIAVLVATASVPQSIQLRHGGRGRGELPAGERGRAEDQRRRRAASTATDRGGQGVNCAGVVRADRWGGVRRKGETLISC